MPAPARRARGRPARAGAAQALWTARRGGLCVGGARGCLVAAAGWGWAGMPAVQLAAVLPALLPKHCRCLWLPSVLDLPLSASQPRSALCSYSLSRYTTEALEQFDSQLGEVVVPETGWETGPARDHLERDLAAHVQATRCVCVRSCGRAGAEAYSAMVWGVMAGCVGGIREPHLVLQQCHQVVCGEPAAWTAAACKRASIPPPPPNHPTVQAGACGCGAGCRAEGSGARRHGGRHLASRGSSRRPVGAPGQGGGQGCWQGGCPAGRQRGRVWPGRRGAERGACPGGGGGAEAAAGARAGGGAHCAEPGQGQVCGGQAGGQQRLVGRSWCCKSHVGGCLWSLVGCLAAVGLGLVRKQEGP